MNTEIISLSYKGDILNFDYIGACANYLIENKIVSGINYLSLCTRILERLKTGKSYRGLTFYDTHTTAL